jgi:hypothetical protein
MKMKILIADDYKKSRDELEEILESKNYKTQTAKDGTQALDFSHTLILLPYLSCQVPFIHFLFLTIFNNFTSIIYNLRHTNSYFK